MAEQAQAQQPTGAKAQILNDRTYQEVEYLKKNLGPILVAALAEICIRRPADPIEYLGHWLLRWRYNEELKRRDVQNALEVVRQKAWTKDDENLQPNPAAPEQPPAPDTFTQGFVPGAAYAPPGYGGPLDQNVVEEAIKPEEETPVAPVIGETQVGQADLEGGAEAKTSPLEQENKISSQLSGQEKQGSGAALEGQRASLQGQQGQTASGEVGQVASGEQQPTEEKMSAELGENRNSVGGDANNTETPEEVPE